MYRCPRALGAGTVATTRNLISLYGLLDFRLDCLSAPFHFCGFVALTSTSSAIEKFAP